MSLDDTLTHTSTTDAAAPCGETDKENAAEHGDPKHGDEEATDPSARGLRVSTTMTQGLRFLSR
jgi:hypothetical protein